MDALISLNSEQRKAMSHIENDVNEISSISIMNSEIVDSLNQDIHEIFDESHRINVGINQVVEFTANTKSVTEETQEHVGQIVEVMKQADDNVMSLEEVVTNLKDML